MVPPALSLHAQRAMLFSLVFDPAGALSEGRAQVSRGENAPCASEGERCSGVQLDELVRTLRAQLDELSGGPDEQREGSRVQLDELVRVLKKEWPVQRVQREEEPQGSERRSGVPLDVLMGLSREAVSQGEGGACRERRGGEQSRAASQTRSQVHAPRPRLISSALAVSSWASGSAQKQMHPAGRAPSGTTGTELPCNDERSRSTPKAGGSQLTSHRRLRGPPSAGASESRDRPLPP